MKKLILILIFISSSLISQTLRVERTDVDSTRFSAVTANYNFGINIYIDDIENCNSASFQLIWSMGDYIHFSGYEIGDYGQSGTVYILPPKSSTETGEKFMNIGVFSGETIGENDFDAPFLLHLKFTVSSNAPNGEIANFRFRDFFATAFFDGEAQNVEVSAEDTPFRIHSFINVWPGDANNDGLVDTRDYNQIGVYFTSNSDDNSYKSFKRENASTMWVGQRVLVWDNADATFADCDGDGVITVADGMVVFQNDSKTHNEGTGLINSQGTGGIKGKEDYDKFFKVPIFAGYEFDYKSITGSISLNTESVIDIIPGDLFENAGAELLIDIKKNNIEFTIGSFDKEFYIDKAGIIAYLVSSEEIDLNRLNIHNAKAMTLSRHILPLSNISSVEQGESNFNMLISDNDIYFKTDIAINSIRIFNILGEIVLSEVLPNKRINHNLKSGAYILIIDSEKGTESKKFILNK